MKENAEKLLIEIYGKIPQPTVGEQMYHETTVDCGTYPEQQLKRDILQLAKAGALTGDEEIIKVALEKWNRIYPNDKYISIDLLVGVEGGEG